MKTHEAGWAHLLLSQSWKRQLIFSKKDEGFRKISSDWNSGLNLIQDAGRAGLTGIHMKKTWVFELRASSIWGQGVSQQKLRRSYPASREMAASRKGNVMVRVTALPRQILKSLVRFCPAVGQKSIGWAELCREQRPGDWVLSGEALGAFSSLWRCGQHSEWWEKGRKAATFKDIKRQCRAARFLQFCWTDRTRTHRRQEDRLKLTELFSKNWSCEKWKNLLCNCMSICMTACK